MRGAAPLLGILFAAILAHGQPLGVHEYAERCVDYYARQYDVSPSLVRAIINVESAWQPGVVSSKGAMGLMQLMPATAQHFGVVHPFYIHENIQGGVQYLAELKEMFHGDLRLMVAAYAAGESPLRWRGLNYSSEEVYRYVLRIREEYRKEVNRESRR
jgi:soluble lytic murein transglycosylase-like protein